MSLSDYIKYLRAVKGGLTPWEIAAGSGVPAREVHLLEVKHRRMGEDDVMLNSLADFFGVAVTDLTSRRDAYRKRFTTFLEESQKEDLAVTFKMEGGEEITGKIEWFGREAAALRPETEDASAPYIVQRSWVADWRLAEKAEWEVLPSRSQ
jgi:hypothetical protein